jgi:hypothetical protein
LLAKAEYDSLREEASAAAKAMVGMCRDVSATTSSSVVGGQKFHSNDHDASILDITDLTAYQLWALMSAHYLLSFFGD